MTRQPADAEVTRREHQRGYGRGSGLRGPAGGPDDLEELLRSASHRMRHRWVEVLQPWELSPHHARALRAIVSSEPLRLSELAERLRVANRSVTDVVDALVERGLAERGRCRGTDGRPPYVPPTPDGN